MHTLEFPGDRFEHTRPIRIATPRNSVAMQIPTRPASIPGVPAGTGAMTDESRRIIRVR